jgi:hypothetical protein
MDATMSPRGWSPEGTATHQRGAASLRDWMRTDPRECVWCWGQEVLWQASEVLGVFVPVTCPHCGPRRDG